MARIYLVRHGEAAARWDQNLDPGLSLAGRQQADAVAERLAALGRMALASSPLQRCRQSAEPLARLWQQEPKIVEQVAEIPSPEERMADRGAWLLDIMLGTWAEAERWLDPWRRGVIDALLAIPDETIVFSHFVAINVAVGAASGDDRVVCFRPGHCSITVLENAANCLSLVERGAEAETVVS